MPTSRMRAGGGGSRESSSSVERSCAAEIGTKLGADGRVAEEAAAFRKGEPVYLTLDIRESPVGLATEAVWKDSKGKELARERHEMKGAKTVTFAMKQPLAPGHYRVEG